MTEMHIIHFEISSPGRAVLICAFCESKGGVPSNYKREHQKPCPVCGGTGKALIDFEQEPFVKCSFCEGKGGVPSNYKREHQNPCNVCSGVGGRPIAGAFRLVK